MWDDVINSHIGSEAQGDKKNSGAGLENVC